MYIYVRFTQIRINIQYVCFILQSVGYVATVARFNWRMAFEIRFFIVVLSRNKFRRRIALDILGFSS